MLRGARLKDYAFVSKPKGVTLWRVTLVRQSESQFVRVKGNKRMLGCL